MSNSWRLVADTGLDIKKSGLPQVVPDQGTLQSAFTLVIGIMAVVAVLIIVLAGLKYITSAGDPQGVAAARKAIIYAGVGLVICSLAWAIVAFTVKAT